MSHDDRAVARLVDQVHELQSKVAGLRRLTGGLCVGLVGLGLFLVGMHLSAAYKFDAIGDAGASAVHADAGGVITARGFRLLDSTGTPRALLGSTGSPVENASHGLHLFTNGRERGEFVVDGHGWAVLNCTDPKGQDRVSLCGESDPTGLTLTDATGESRAEMMVWGSGSPMITMTKTGSLPSLELGVTGEGKGQVYLLGHGQAGETQAVFRRVP